VLPWPRIVEASGAAKGDTFVPGGAGVLLEGEVADCAQAAEIVRLAAMNEAAAKRKRFMA
jgi:hypothetical protein